MKYRRLLSVAVLTAATVSATATLANDVGPWSGFYAGVAGGYGLSRSNPGALPGDPNTARSISLPGGTGPLIPALASTDDGHGWFAGGLAGYNWQFGTRGILGLEADLSSADISGRGASAVSIFAGTSPATFDTSHRLRWFGTLRGRAGVLPTENLLLYATGGVAVGGLDTAASLNLGPGQTNGFGFQGFGFDCGVLVGGPSCFAGSHSRTGLGWVAGVGGEYRATQKIALRFEYLYLDFGRAGYRLPAVFYGTSLPSVLNASADAKFSLLRLGASYRF